MSNIPNLASLARLRLWSWGWSTVRRKAFWFDWTNDYISSNATIGRTGYDLNVSGNVTTGSDGDGDYLWINWNKDATIPTGTNAEIQTTTNPTINQTTSFTISSKFKFNGVVPSWWSMWVFWRSNIISLYADNSAWTNLAKFRIRNWGTFTDVTFTAVASTVYTVHWTFDATINKMYLYVNGVLQNVWWTTVAAATFWWTQNFILWDWWLGWGNVKSLSTYIYHACIRNKALSQAEIDADIALWNTTKQDPSIVAYYVPENLQYNTQYIANPKALDQSPRAYTGATVTANTDVAPDGTTTADNIVFWAATHRLVQQTITAITWSALASKTFIVKAFVKCTTGTQTFRFRMDHAGVDTNQYSSDFTATTTRQEFTFTRALTSSTSWTWLFIAVANNSAWTAQTIQVRNVRVYLVNQTLRDESPNIWWFIGRKTQKVLSCRIKPWADWISSSQSQTLFYGARGSFYINWTTNILTKSIVTRLWAKAHTATALWNWYRSKVHVVWTISYTWWAFVQKIYVNWVLSWSSAGSNDVPTSLFASGLINIWVNTWVYFSWNIRDARIYTFTWSFTDADALAIYNWWEPTSAWVTKYLHYRPPVGEVGTTTQDQSPNDRDWTLNGGVTRDYI